MLRQPTSGVPAKRVSSPLVTIGMPVRNCEKTLGPAIRSILHQTYGNWELLVIDDGSTDDTIRLARGFRDPRIHILADGGHRGIARRLNQAVELSHGEYFARMDGDDVSFPERLALQVAWLERNPSVDLLGAGVVVFRGNGEMLGTRAVVLTHEEICRRPCAGFPLPHPTWIGRTEWFRNHPYRPDAIRAEDQDLLLRTCRASRFASLPDVLLGYREESLRLGGILRGRWSYLRGSLFANDRALEPRVGLPLTILWVLLITNAFNLIDGLDGLAAGSAFFSTVVMFVISLQLASPIVSLLTIILAGAILGFLRYNFHPASIFLGDSGSLFIGFLLSAVALAGSQKSTTVIAVAIPVVSFGLPILDVALSIARRFLGGKPIFLGDCDHIHHKLLQRGLSQRESALVLYGVTAGFGLLSLVLFQDRATLAVVLVVIGLGVGFGVQQLRYAEFSELFSLAQRTLQTRRSIVGNLRIRRAADALDRCADFAVLCRILQETLEPLGFDGFAFESPRAGILSDWSFAPLRRLEDGRLQYAWNVFGLGPAEPGWELAFELSPRSGERWGQFRLFRRDIDEPLFFDLNLLYGRFRERLAEAAARSMSQCLPAPEMPASERTHLVTSVTIAR